MKHEEMPKANADMQRTVVASSALEVLDDLDRRGIQGAARERAVNNFISLKARQKDIPVSGTFELTPLCNLSCKMCYVHLQPDQMGKDGHILSVDAWTRIIDQAIDAGMIFASLTGGECLTYPGFRELYLHLYKAGIQPSILTNGVLLTEDLIDFLAQYPPSVIQVSLYGSSDEAYKKVCGVPAFDQVIEGIRRAREKHLYVTLAMTPNRYMQDDTEALIDCLHRLGLQYTISGVTIPARPDTGRELADYVVDLDVYMRIREIEAAYFKTIPPGETAPFVPKYIPPESKHQDGLPCGGGHSAFHVNWKGELCPCIPYATDVHIGMLSSDFSRAWNELRRRMSAYTPPAECSICPNAKQCLTCPGECGMGKVQGQLNSLVCDRLRRRIDSGTIPCCEPTEI